jgi:hypothetical protein
VNAGGAAVGGVSGGCVEVLALGEPVLERFGAVPSDSFAICLTRGGSGPFQGFVVRQLEAKQRVSPASGNSAKTASAADIQTPGVPKSSETSNHASQISRTPVAAAGMITARLRRHARMAVVTKVTSSSTSKPTHVVRQA